MKAVQDTFYLSTAEAAEQFGVTPAAIHRSYQEGVPMPVNGVTPGARCARFPLPWVARVRKLQALLGVTARRAMILEPQAIFRKNGSVVIVPKGQ